MEEVLTEIKDVLTVNEDRTLKEEVFTRAVRAGKRTYFFDVKITRKDDFYLTITESKKRAGKDGKVFYEKHKIFLYKEDFDKFLEGLKDAVTYIDSDIRDINSSNETPDIEDNNQNEVITSAEFTNIDFDDLGKK